MNATILLTLRIILGFIYLIFGINFFFPFLPIPLLDGDAGDMMRIFFRSGWMSVIKTIEVVAGILLITNQFIRLAAVMIAPVSINIFLFHLLVAGQPIIGAVLLVLNGLILFAYRADLKGLFRRV